MSRDELDDFLDGVDTASGKTATYKFKVGEREESVAYNTCPTRGGNHRGIVAQAVGRLLVGEGAKLSSGETSVVEECPSCKGTMTVAIFPEDRGGRFGTLFFPKRGR